MRSAVINCDSSAFGDAASRQRYKLGVAAYFDIGNLGGSRSASSAVRKYFPIFSDAQADTSSRLDYHKSSDTFSLKLHATDKNPVGEVKMDIEVRPAGNGR